jgi:hypothetical protein
MLWLKPKQKDVETPFLRFVYSNHAVNLRGYFISSNTLLGHYHFSIIKPAGFVIHSGSGGLPLAAFDKI